MQKELHCLRCGNNWNSWIVPKQCPQCKTPLWNKKYSRPDMIGKEKR